MTIEDVVKKLELMSERMSHFAQSGNNEVYDNIASNYVRHLDLLWQERAFAPIHTYVGKLIETDKVRYKIGETNGTIRRKPTDIRYVRPSD